MPESTTQPRPADNQQRFDFRLTPFLESLLRGRAADDPLALQFLPDVRELNSLAYESADPIGDGPHSPTPGIVHRYPDRVLLKVAHACAVYCRFCFRREMIGSKGTPLMRDELDAAINYIRGRPEVWEVILTGGDPFTLSARRLADIVGRLAAIAHVSVIRIHTRAPITAPDSIDNALVLALACSLPMYVAVHVNHPDELSDPVVAALLRLSGSGIVLLSQTVLLKGVNDNVGVLEALFRRLVRLKVRPYYLHHPDLAPGTAHFRVPIEVGQALMRELRGRVSGLCQPIYVLDIPGGYGKVPVGPGYLGRDAVNGVREVLDYCGERHGYPE